MTVQKQFVIEKILQPQWNQTTLYVMSEYRDTEVKTPEIMIGVPQGVWVMRVTNETRFSVTPVLVRAGREIELDPVVSVGMVDIVTESDAEMSFKISGTASVLDNRSTRVGVTLFRLSGA